MTQRTAHLPLAHVLLALAVTAVWGSNFVVIKVALAHLPPLLFAALRFVFAFFPAVLFLRRPSVPWTSLAAYGLLIGVGQFGLLYIALGHDISPGLGSLVVQMQVFFTVALAARFTGERVHLYQVLSLVLAAAGLAVIAWHGGRDATPLGLALTVLAALSWAGGNVVAKASRTTQVLAYVVWASIFAVPPLFALSFAFEGWPSIAAGLRAADAATWAAVLYQSIGNTLFGYGLWAWLLARHPAATVSPFSLLVPIVGMTASALLLGEAIPSWKIAAGLFVLAGLALNLAWPRLRLAMARPSA